MKRAAAIAMVSLAVGLACGSDPDSAPTAPSASGDAPEGGTVAPAPTASGSSTNTPPPGTDGGPAVTEGGPVSPPGTIWHPTPGTTWQWQLTGTIDTTVDASMFDIDLEETDPSVIQTLHDKARKVICYFSAGSSEDWRSDFSKFTEADQGNGLAGWPGERWLDVRSSNVRDIMKARLDVAVSKKCDGVEPDNVDGFDNDSGLTFTKTDELDYLAFLEKEAHARGLSIGLKNALALVPQLVGTFDWALNEECLANSECNDLEPFIQANKAVFHTEYTGDQNTVCNDPTRQGFSTLIKNMSLDAWRIACP